MGSRGSTLCRGQSPNAIARGGSVSPGGDFEARIHAERHPGAGAEGGRGPEAKAGGGPKPEAEAETRGGPEPEPEAESTRGPEAGGERNSHSPLHLGRPRGWPRRRWAESSPQSRGGSSSTPSSRGWTATFSSPTPASMEPLLQVLAAADSTVREGLNAQVQALAEERAALEAEWAQLAADRARVDEGRRAVDDMVKVGRKMCQAQLAEIQAREETLDIVMRETEEERQAALIASSVLDEALGDIRL